MRMTLRARGLVAGVAALAMIVIPAGRANSGPQDDPIA
jgi:hypothetical protein